MRWPGYYDGTPNGVWNIGPDEFDARSSSAYHRAGLQVHIHTNGDEASEVAIERDRAGARDAPRAATTATRCSTARWPMRRSSAA